MLDKLRHIGKKVISGIRWPLKTFWNILKWFFKGGAIRFLLGIGLLLVLVIYAAYQLPEDIVRRSRLLLDVLWRLLSWLFGSTVVRSILGLISLLAVYCILYYWFRIRKRRFVVVSEFRVWGDQAQKFPEKGMVARLRDELMRLCNWMVKPDQPSRSAIASPDEASSAEQEFSRAREVLGGDVDLLLPETHVTLQYEGISLEAIHTLVRRITGREMVITGDLMSHLGGLKLIARTTDDGPWEVLVENSDSATLENGLQKLALRIITTMMQIFKTDLKIAFAMLQIKARELQDYDQALILAELAHREAPDLVTAKWNLATAHNDIGVELALSEKYEEAIDEFEEARKWNPQFEEAYVNLGHAYKKVGKKQNADNALKKAEKIRREQSKSHAR